MRKIAFILIILITLWGALGAQAQDFSVDPNANITWPPPVYVLRGAFELRGTANLPNLANYFLEYRPLNDDLSTRDNTGWIPASLPSAARVVDGLLGVWDTRSAADGLYELRMTLNVTSGQPVYVIVSPLRVENTPPPFAVTPEPTVTPFPTATPELVITNTPLPTATVVDLTPRAEAVTNANVRQGDSTFYPVITGLTPGQIVPIVGISNTGSGWFQIELPGGGRGWVSPTVVRTQGDLNRVPRVAPPPPPPPTATPTPAAQANLVITALTLAPDPPACNETFTITARVYNAGTGSTGVSGSLLVQDFHVGSNTLTATTNGGFPALEPSQSFDVVMRLTVSVFFEEQHRLAVIVDSLSQVPETNEGDNVAVREYRLRRGNC
jgi:hypothetical protein